MRYPSGISLSIYAEPAQAVLFRVLADLRLLYGAGHVAALLDHAGDTEIRGRAAFALSPGPWPCRKPRLPRRSRFCRASPPHWS